MRNYTFDFELETIFTMFISALDDIIVKRFNVNKVPEEQIKVRFVYAPKQRVLNDLVDKSQTIQLPVVSVTNGGIVRDTTRVFNKIAGSNVMGSVDPRYINRLLQPIPVDITVNVSILTRYQKDFDQIVTNIFPYFDPYIVLSWRTPSLPNEEIRSNVYWSGNIATTYPTDVDASKAARVQGDTSFTIKGWLFKALAKDSDNTIFTINTDFNQTKDITTQYTLEQLDQAGDERVTVSGVPKPINVDLPALPVSTQNQTIRVYGESFFKIQNIYLSGDTNFNSNFFSPFSASNLCTVNLLSALYPGFTGIQLLSTDYSVYNDTLITINMPQATNSGFVDIIVQNEAGYGSLIKNAPYPALLSAALVNPLLSGIHIF
jgi:hypothetical protein